MMRRADDRVGTETAERIPVPAFFRVGGGHSSACFLRVPSLSFPHGEENGRPGMIILPGRECIIVFSVRLC